MAETFIDKVGADNDTVFVTKGESGVLHDIVGLDIAMAKYRDNLELLLEVLYSFQLVLNHTDSEDFAVASPTIDAVTDKITRFVFQSCTTGPFAEGDTTVTDLYQAFYRKLVYRDRALPRPWVFTTNYDLFNEIAMDRLGIPYSNGFSGVVERRFNPAVFRYSLAEQLDISSRKWTAVDNFVYLCKLHGSVSWIEESGGLFPIRETQNATPGAHRLLIYPTPAKQNASFGSPYSDLFREFQSRIAREQSVLFVVGYGFADEHVNNIIFRALTVPTFRMVAFVPPNALGTVATLRALGDPRVWLIGGAGSEDGRYAHFFDTFVENFMTEPPGDKVDSAIVKVLETLIAKPDARGGDDDDG
jgi:hypothetical protein